MAKKDKTPMTRAEVGAKLVEMEALIKDLRDTQRKELAGMLRRTLPVLERRTKAAGLAVQGCEKQQAALARAVARVQTFLVLHVLALAAVVAALVR